MARIRYLKPEFFLDEDIKNLPYESRLFFQGLWCQADKSGRLEDRPERLKVQIMPYDKIDPYKTLDLLASNKTTGRPFIQRYQVDGESYIQILSWEKHQKPHHTEKDSEIPNPPKYIKGKDKENGEENGECSSSKLDLSNSLKTVNKPLKIQHLEFVTLTEEEHKKLTDSLGCAKLVDSIERLNNYIGSTGKRYKSHYHTILNWVKRDGDIGKKDSGLKKDFVNYDKEIEQKLSKIATKEMIMSVMRELPENIWWKVEKYLNKRYPGGGNGFIEAEREIVKESRNNLSKIKELTESAS